MNWSQTEEEVKNLFYQCEFRQVVEIVDNLSFGDKESDRYFNLQLIKSSALFEMHQVPRAKDLLAQLTAEGSEHSPNYLYVLARVSYLDRDYQKAENLFQLLADRSDSVRTYFKAILGLANVYYSLNRQEDYRVLIPEIEELIEHVSPDEKLSLYLLQATATNITNLAMDEAKKLFQEVIQQAARWRWNYFIIKGLYGLASLYRKHNLAEAMESTLDILKCYLDPKETVYLTYLVNEKFKEQNFTLTSALQFDMEYKRVSVDGQWIPLHDKPLIYKFLEVLSTKGTFVSKKEIADYLWPDQNYDAKVFDPRIFDIARRVRLMIEPYENQPVSLLSGRLGYKLAAQTTNREKSNNLQQER